ncbi:MAG TPA: thioredoxin domain-containing protein, partial [Polyangia bacterium]
MKLSVLLVLLGTASACRSTTPTKSTSVTASPEASQRPVAKVGGETITEAELQTAVKPRLVRLETEHAEKVHGLKSQSLDELIANRLIANKAKAEGITAEALVEREVNAKVKPAGDAELQAFYDQAKGSGQQLPPFEQVKGEIANFLRERGTGQAKKDLVDRLRAETKVEKMMPPLLLPKVQVAAEGYAKGDPKAPITIVEFSDYECPFCSRAEDAVKRVLKEYEGKVRVVYRDFPLPFHGKAQKASEAALCAGDQGKYWEMHEKLFANQQALDVTQLKDHAKAVGVDQAKFDQCLDSNSKASVVEASKKAGEAAGVSG